MFPSFASPHPERRRNCWTVSPRIRQERTSLETACWYARARGPRTPPFRPAARRSSTALSSINPLAQLETPAVNCAWPPSTSELVFQCDLDDARVVRFGGDLAERRPEIHHVQRICEVRGIRCI